MAYRRTAKVIEHEINTRSSILRGASSLVRAEKPLTMEAVAARAGLSVGSLYTYFRNRGELLLALFDYRASQELAMMQAALGNDLPPADALARAVRVQLERGFASPGMALFLLLERMDRDPRLEQAKLDYHRRHCAALAACIERGVGTGDFPPQPVHVSAAAILGAIIEVLTRALAGTGEPLRELDRAGLETALVGAVLGICRYRGAK